MKITTLLFLGLLFIFNFSYCQTTNCDDYIVVRKDKMTDETSYWSKAMLVSKDNTDGFLIKFVSMQGMIAISIEAYGGGSCIEEKSLIIILFRDGTKMNLHNVSEFNCENEIGIPFLGEFGNSHKLNMLQTKEIETMRAYTQNGYVQEDFTKQNSLDFMNILNCLKSYIK